MRRSPFARLAVVAVVAFAMPHGAGATQHAAGPAACEVTDPIPAPPVADWNGLPFPRGRCYATADRTLWASLGWEAGDLEAIGQSRDDRRRAEHSLPWIRPPDAPLTVAGRRVDGEAPPMQLTLGATIAGRYVPSRVRFPTSGCWEVTGMAGASRLTIVVSVETPPAPSASIGR